MAEESGSSKQQQKQRGSASVVSSEEDPFARRVAETDKYFNRLVKLVPFHHYRPSTEEEMDRFYVNKKKSKQEKAQLDALKKKGRLQRLDPEANAAPAVEEEEDADQPEVEHNESPENEDELNEEEPDFMQHVTVDELRERLNRKLAKYSGSSPIDRKRKFACGPNGEPLPRKKLRQLEQEKKKQKGKKEASLIPDDNEIKRKEGQLKNKPEQHHRSSKQQQLNAVSEPVVFSKFDFGSSSGNNIKTLGLPQKGHRNAQDMLKLLEKKKENQKKFQEKVQADSDGTSKIVQVQQESRWNSALVKAEGGKVLDDVEKLKKSVQRKQREKKKSALQWKARLSKVKSEQVGRQEKRRENIGKRIQEKKDRKMGVVNNNSKNKKKRPGFEGNSLRKK